MPALILYLLKANIALVLFYLVYHLVLRKLTFYHLNRLFLVFGIVFSALYPFVDLTELFSQHQELAVIHSTYAVALPAHTPVVVPEEAAPFDYWIIPVILFWLGCSFMSIRLLFQFVALYRIHRKSIPDSFQGVNFRKVNGITEAFSFWKNIYLNPSQHLSPELESILRHEQIHVNGWHTLDVLLAEISTIFYWFNPGVWLMKKALKENLEFIADQHVVAAGVDRKEYQYLLLKVVGATQPQIANQFNFPSLKRRITMMNKKQSSLMQVIRYAIVVPLVAAPTLMLTANSKTPEATTEVIAVQTVQDQTGSKRKLPDNAIYFIDGTEATKDAASKLDPKDIHGINVLKGENAQEVFGERAANGVISIVTIKNKDSKQVQELHEKFPKPPVPPKPVQELLPPSPPTPTGEELPPPPPPAPEKPGTPPPPPAPAKEQLSPLAPNSSDTKQAQGTKKEQPTVKTITGRPSSDSKAAAGSVPLSKEQLNEVTVTGRQSAPPPPPVRHDEPLIPGSGAKLVEDEKTITYILWPGETTKREFIVAKNVFKESGFDLNFDETYSGDKLVGIRITLKSNKKGSNNNAVYNTTNLDALRESDNVIVVKANKETGELILGTTIAKK